MANIKAFRALMPNEVFIKDLLYQKQAGTVYENAKMLKDLIEPKGLDEVGQLDLDFCRTNLERLVADGTYQLQDEESIFIYELDSIYGKQHGIWALTAVQDLMDGVLVIHEDTLVEKEDRIKCYRKEVGIEAMPILLTYRPHQDIEELIREIIHIEKPFEFSEDGITQRLWNISETVQINRFKNAFKKVGRAYVADGHHRLASAADLHQNNPQCITALYVSSAHIRIREFNRLVRPDFVLDKMSFFNQLAQYFYISALPGNVPYRPDRIHRLGMCYEQQWFQLDLKIEESVLHYETDASILQNKVLKPIFGIDDPKNNQRLTSFPASQWSDFLEANKAEPTSVAFSLFPMSIDQLIYNADHQLRLPPKSTFIEPKIPYGLLLYSEKHHQEMHCRKCAEHQ